MYINVHVQINEQVVKWTGMNPVTQCSPEEQNRTSTFTDPWVDFPPPIPSQSTPASGKHYPEFYLYCDILTRQYIV